MINRKIFYVHRLVYCEKAGVSINDISGLVVRHKCDNPSCVNADHLEIGTQADNMMDKKLRCRGFASPETLIKMKNAQIKRRAENPVSEETRLKLSESHKGHRPSNETREKMRIAATGRKSTIETKMKIVQSWVIRRAEKEKTKCPA
jgi:hypothetical protein